MALKLWFPLNKDTKNVGLTKCSISSVPVITPSYVDGPIDKALSFNGTTFWKSQNISLGNEATIACWSKTNTNQRMTWVLESDASNKLNLYESTIYTLNTGDSNNNPFKTSSNSNINVLHDNNWHHFAVTFGDSVAKLYIDGTYAGTSVTFRSPKTTNKPIKIGGGFNNGHTYDWNGGIADFRIYDHCLTEYDIKRLSQQKIFEFQPYSILGNDLLFDKSGYVLKNFINSQAKFNRNSIYFNGTNQIIRSKEIGFEISGGTLPVWFLPKTKPSGNGTIFYLDGNSRMACGLYNNAANFIVSTKTSSPMFPATGVTYGEWNHVCITYGTNFVATNCYLNGIKLTGSGSNNWSETDSYVKIGGRESYNSFFDGSVANVEVYSKQLSEEECINIYNTKKLELFLPDEYEELEYIESTGTQWIDTGKMFLFGDEFYFEFMPLSNSVSVENKGYGAGTNISTNNITGGGRIHNGYMQMWIIGADCTYTPTISSGESRLNKRYIENWKIEEGVLNVSLTDIENKITHIGIANRTQFTSGFNSGNNIYLFRDNSTTYTYLSATRIYKTWLKRQNGTFEFYLLPSKRKSDNVIGMYDMISRQFFTNSGTGSFTGA